MRWERVSAANLKAELERANCDFHLMTSFLAMLQMPAFVKDKAGRLLYLNSRAETFWKLKASDAIGKAIANNRQLEKEFRDSDRKVIERGAAHVFHHPERDPHSFTAIQFPFVDADGHRLIAGLVITHGA